MLLLRLERGKKGKGAFFWRGHFLGTCLATIWRDIQRVLGGPRGAQKADRKWRRASGRNWAEGKATGRKVGWK